MHYAVICLLAWLGFDLIAMAVVARILFKPPRKH